MTRYAVIHGHLYQPPREDPWSGVVPREETAAPYANWNERITAECYRPNALAGAGPAGRGGVYRSLSFNVGPTLARWLELEAPDVHEALVAADHDTQGALAQPWVHAILPLAPERDRVTLVQWGIDDFRCRFGRTPHGMWLPETAVDTPTLETLAGAGIEYTILAPWQLRSGIDPGDGEGGGEDTIDPSHPYRLDLPSGRSLLAATYDGKLAGDVAFGDALQDGSTLARRLLDGGDANGDGPLRLIAVDFETFGHHRREGPRALADALVELAASPDTVVGSLTTALARADARPGRLREPSSWSCAHGVERWRSDCGCCTAPPGPHGQSWRTPLRDALDWLRDAVAAAELAIGLHDPWRARDQYGLVLAGTTTLEEWLPAQLAPGGNPERAATWLELQRHLLLMFSSCGWFFDDAAGYETLINLRHAARALELAGSLGATDLERGFVERLQPMRSDVHPGLDGTAIWHQLVRPPRVSG